MENFLIKILHKVFSPLITKEGYLKLPRNKKARFIYIFLFMIVMMIVSIIYLEVKGIW